MKCRTIIIDVPDAIPKDWHWTKDEYKDDPRCAYVVSMVNGSVTYGSRGNPCSVRAVSAFRR